MPRQSQKNSQTVLSQPENDENSNSGDDDETEISTSTIPQALREQLINDIIRYILICQQKGVTIKRSDISRDILKNNKRNFSEIFVDVRKRLEDVFGILVYETETKKNNYIIVNQLAAENRSLEKNLETSKLGLLGVILTYLFMKNPDTTSVVEKDVLRFLGKLDVDFTKRHPTYGDVKQFFTRELVQKNYICISKIQKTEDVQETEWSWGERARREFWKRDCLKTYCAIYRDVFTPDLLRAHVEKINADES